MPAETGVPRVEIGQAATLAFPRAISVADITNASAVAPSAVQVKESSTASEAGITPASIASAKGVPPQALSGFRGLNPVQEAGVGLARFVLWLIAAATAAVFLCLIAIEISNLQAYNSVSQGLLSYAGKATDGEALRQRMAGVIAIFRGARDQTTPKISRDESALVNDLVRDLRGSGRLSDDQAMQLNSCVGQIQAVPSGAVPNLTEHQATMDACVRALASVDLDILGLGLDIERLRIMREIGKDALDAGQAVRSFWLSIAQLVLLNLLLPILTALLGYIFGTQQQQQPPS